MLQEVKAEKTGDIPRNVKKEALVFTLVDTFEWMGAETFGKTLNKEEDKTPV